MNLENLGIDIGIVIEYRLLRYSRVSRGNETNVKTQLFRREENKRLVSFCRGMFTLLTNLSVPKRNETNHDFIVISFIPS